MKIFINYANKVASYQKQQTFALKMARLRGGFDKVIGYGPDDIDASFFEENKDVLNEKRGGGLWLWKPYVILKTLESCNDGDYVFYADSGFFVTKKINSLIEALEKSDQDIMAFSTYYPENQWTKRRLFELMDCEDDVFKKTNQFIAGIVMVKNSEYSRNFFKELISYARDREKIVDARPDEIQEDCFIEHRHDQSIFSLLCKKHGLKSFRTPFIFGEKGAAYAVMKKTEKAYGKNMDFNFIDFENSNYPTILQVNREFGFLGMRINIFLISYVYLSLLNMLPFQSWTYNFLLNLGLGSQKSGKN